MAKITELPSLSANDVNPASNLLPVVAGNQTDRATLNDLLEGYFNRGALTSGSAAALKNCLPRFKYLGTFVTNEQRAAIQNGTFDGLFLGDYWTINGVDYIIAAFDYWLSTGGTPCTEHHVVVIPRNNLYTYKFNSTDTTKGGYVGSDLYKTGLAQAKSTIDLAFGHSHILSHGQHLVNAVTNGKPTGSDEYNSTVELMNENMVYGGRQFSPMPDGTDPLSTCRNYTIDKSQLPLFHFAPWLICNGHWYWLRDVVSAAGFARVSGAGVADHNRASNAGGVRPVVGLIG